MDPAEYLKAVRRRWLIVAAALIAALATAWLTMPTVATPAPTYRSYDATTVLLSGTFGPTGVTRSVFSGNLNTIAALATVGQVPIDAAKALHYPGRPSTLAAGVKAVAETQTGLLRITATDPSAHRAENISEAFAKSLITFLRTKQSGAIADQIKFFQAQLKSLSREIGNLQQRINALPLGSQKNVLSQQRDAKIRSYGTIYSSYQQLSSVAPDSGDLFIIQDPVATPSAQSTGIQLPRSRKTRLLLAAILGLLAGLALALILERFDTRIKTKHQAERHFGHPVLAEIPVLPRRQRGLDAVARSASASGRIFRLLGAGVTGGAIDRRPTDGSGNGSVGVPPRTILVTSASPGDGKTFIAGNLAATFAQIGKKVIILSCDFHRPAIHKLFDVANEGGLAEALGSDDGQPLLNGHVRVTSVPGVQLVPSGVTPERPGELLNSERMLALLEEARQEADFVILDSAPIVAAGESAGLLHEVDAVLVVANARKTTTELAELTSELLARFRANVVGVALNEASDAPRQGRYHYYWDDGGIPSLVRHLLKR